MEYYANEAKPSDGDREIRNHRFQKQSRLEMRWWNLLSPHRVICLSLIFLEDIRGDGTMQVLAELGHCKVCFMEFVISFSGMFDMSILFQRLLANLYM